MANVATGKSTRTEALVRLGRSTARRPRSWLARARRYVRYRLLIPMFRSRHPPEYTARGVAIGVFWGVTPFLGAQTLLMIGTWQVLRRVFQRDASLLQALAWAWINNPLTMLPMYYAFYLTGLWLTGGAASLGGYAAFLATWEEGARQPTWLAGAEVLARQLGVSLVVGSLPYALLGSWAAYRWSLALVRAHRRIRDGRGRAAPPGSMPTA